MMDEFEINTHGWYLANLTARLHHCISVLQVKVKGNRLQLTLVIFYYNTGSLLPLSWLNGGSCHIAVKILIPYLAYVPQAIMMSYM